MSSKTMRIMLLGPSGVGKTTLLASLSKEIASINQQNKYRFICTDETQAASLKKIEDELSHIKNDAAFKGAANVGLKSGTLQAINQYPFTLSKDDKKLLDIEIIDHRGGDITSTADQNNVLREELRKANVIINVIDGTYLMIDEYGIQDAEINQYSFINHHIADRLNHDTKVPLLVLFVITKCEKWARQDKRTSEDYQQLIAKAENQLKQSIQTIEQKAQKNRNVAAVLLPVITINSVEFLKATQTEKNGIVEYHPEFFKNPRYEYQPQATLPLKLALAFSMKYKIGMENIFSYILSIFKNEGNKRDIWQALDDFANKDLNLDQYKSYGDKSLLEFKN
jgi:flagellar biosynthesis GTPase FlhF